MGRPFHPARREGGGSTIRLMRGHAHLPAIARALAVYQRDRRAGEHVTPYLARTLHR